MEVKGYQNNSLDIHQDFIVENNIETKKIYKYLKFLDVNTIKYNNISISDQITVLNNFNSYANLNINTLNVDTKLKCSNIVVNDSIFIKNNANFIYLIYLFIIILTVLFVIIIKNMLLKHLFKINGDV